MRKIGLFRRKNKENRAETAVQPTQPTEENGQRIVTLEGLLGADDVVTREQALEIPTVAACVNKIAETVARLPLHLHRRIDDKVTEVENDRRVKLLNGETGDAMNSVEMWTAAVADYYLGRGAWIFIAPEFKSIHYVDSRSVGIRSSADPIYKQFRVNVGGREYFDFQFIKLLRKTPDGWTNTPIQEESNIILSAAYNALRLENQMNANGGCKPGFLKSEYTLSNDAITSIKSSYKRMYSNNSKDIVVLNRGIEFQPAASTAVEMQMNESKATNSVEICKLFGFPHTVIDGGASEEDKKQFIGAVIALLNRIETALDAVMLYEDEKADGLYFSFDTKELTRGNLKERYEAYEIAVRNRILQVDEIRREEDYEPIGFNFVTLGLGDVLLDPETKEIFTPNTGQQTNLLTGEQRADGMDYCNYLRYLQTALEVRAAEIELRYNHNHDSHGRFARGGGGSAYIPLDKSGKSSDNGIDSAYGAKNYDEKRNNTVKIYSNAENSYKMIDKYDINDIMNNIKSSDSDELKKAIADGTVKTKLDKKAQSAHKLGSEEYNKRIANGELPSYTEMSNMEIQKIINESSGTGEVHKGKDGQFREVIKKDDFKGMYGDRTSGDYVPTDRATIHYSKKGTHLVPAAPIK